MDCENIDFRPFVFEDLEEDVAKMLVNNSNYVGKKLSTDSRVPGRINNPEFFSFWKDELKASDYILDVIKNGYKIPFKSIPPPSFCDNNKSMLKEKDFAYQELLRLESLGCISRVKERPYIVLPLSVVFSKKQRLVVDASRHLNPFIEDRKVKLEDLEVGEKMMKQGDYQTSDDLDSGYWHLKMHEEHKKYVGCHFVLDSGEVIYWHWNVLFLGLKDAVFIFTKLLIPHKTYLRSKGVRLHIFIDDQRIFSVSYDQCVKDTKFARETLERAGWTVNEKKSSGDPKQSLNFLGLISDSVSMKYFVPDEKINDICDSIKTLINSKRKKVHIKKLARILGKIQFCQKAMGPCVRLLCRSSYHLISKAKSWNSMILLSDGAIKELSFLADNFRNLNGQPLRPSLSQTRLDITVGSDASDIGFCVYNVDDNRELLFKRLFNDCEARKSSTYRELTAFYDFYMSDKVLKFKNLSILHYTDNKNCEIILTNGSRNVVLQQMILDIFIRWKELNLTVNVVYISRNDPIIEFADYESRTFDLHDFSLDFDNFYLVSSLFGEFEIDCFASKANKKCVNYYSKFQDNDSLGMNFFAQKVPNCNLFVFPPIHLIIPALYHLQKCNSYGVLIVPKWISSYFWTFICDDGCHFNRFIKSVLVFSPKFVSGEFVLNSMFKGVKKFDTLALKFNFNISNAFSSQVHSKFCILGGCVKCKDFC